MRQHLMPFVPFVANTGTCRHKLRRFAFYVFVLHYLHANFANAKRDKRPPFIKAWKNMRFSSADTAKYNCQMFFTDRYFYF